MGALNCQRNNLNTVFSRIGHMARVSQCRGCAPVAALGIVAGSGRLLSSLPHKGLGLGDRAPVRPPGARLKKGSDIFSINPRAVQQT